MWIFTLDNWIGAKNGYKLVLVLDYGLTIYLFGGKRNWSQRKYQILSWWFLLGMNKSRSKINNRFEINVCKRLSFNQPANKIAFPLKSDLNNTKPTARMCAQCVKQMTQPALKIIIQAASTLHVRPRGHSPKFTTKTSHSCMILMTDFRKQLALLYS